MGDDTLKQIAAWILTGGGAGALALWVMDHLKLGAWNDEQKRWLSWVLGGVFALLAWGGEIAMLWVQPPADWREGISQAATVIGVAFTASQLGHARMKQSRARRALLRG